MPPLFPRARPDHRPASHQSRSADPRLNAEPAARHHRAQKRGQVRAAHPKRRAKKHRKRNPVLRARMRIQQHGNQHNQIAQQHRADACFQSMPLAISPDASW
jgi:hypothetical protein